MPIEVIHINELTLELDNFDFEAVIKQVSLAVMRHFPGLGTTYPEYQMGIRLINLQEYTVDDEVNGIHEANFEHIPKVDIFQNTHAFVERYLRETIKGINRQGFGRYITDIEIIFTFWI